MRNNQVTSCNAMNRSRSLEIAFLIFAVTTAQHRSVSAQDTTRRPNMVVIMADDLGYADLGCYGCKDIRTPRLDQLASQGVRFTSAYVTGSMCGPSRAGFITGRNQSCFGYYSNARNPLDPKQGLPAGTTTVASYLQAQGYRTGGVGKWHMGTADHQHPNELGYSDWYGFLSGGLTYYPLEHPSYKGRYETMPRPWGLRDMHHTLPILHNKTPVKWDQYVTHELTDAGVRFIEQKHDKPFYLFMSYNAPHEELEAPQETIAKYPESATTEIPGVKPTSRSIYAAMVDEMDQGIGRLLDTLDEQGIADNTVVMFLSDHGGMKKTSDNRPLRGTKGTNYDGGFRVPLIIRWPGRIAPGGVLDSPVTSLDLGATSLAIAGGELRAADLHGKDITAYLTGKTAQPPHKTLYWRTGPPPKQLGIVLEGGYRLLMTGKEVELYNLNEDIGETINIADQHQTMVRRMTAGWKDWDQISQPPLWKPSRNKNKFQFADYDWLKGSPHYQFQPKSKSGKRTRVPK